MLIIRRKKHGINFIKVWWAEEELQEQGIIQYHQAKGEWASRLDGAVRYDTLVNNISGDDDSIKSFFSKSCKYKVNRASREDVDIKIYDSTDVTDEMIEEFLDFFEEFWNSKDIELKEKDSLRIDLKEYRDNAALSLAIGYVSGEKAIYHTHVYDSTRARLLHSASLYRLKSDEEGSTKNVIGMANRFLHYREMLFFRDKGLTEYDWGGAGRGEDVINITEFKESFGGEPETDMDLEVTRGCMAHLFRLAVRILRR